jgi:hypothetical protein
VDGNDRFGNLPGAPSKEKTGSANATPDVAQTTHDIDNVNAKAAASRRSTCNVAIGHTPNSSSSATKHSAS